MRKCLAAILGAFIIFIAAEGLLRVGGLLHLKSVNKRNRGLYNEGGTINILCTGDSMTYNQYPLPLEKILNERVGSESVRFNLIDEGRPGVGSNYVAGHIRAHIKKHNPSLILVMTGFNDRSGEVSYGALPLGRRSLFRVFDLVRLLSYNLSEKFSSNEITFPEDGFESKGSSSPKELKETTLTLEEKVLVTSILEEAQRIRFNQGQLAATAHIEKYLIEYANLVPLYKELANIYRESAIYDKLEITARAWLKINPNSSEAKINLGLVYGRHLKDSDLAEKYLTEALKTDPYNSVVFSLMGSIKMYEGDREGALECFEKALAIDPYNDEALDRGGRILEEMQEYKRATEYYNRAFEAYYKNRNIKQLAENLNFVRDEALKKNIPILFIQYPMRELDELKNLISPHPSVYFVGNYANYKKLVEEKGYWAVFTDRFGGNFGHMTNMGNQFLADHITDTIIKDIFHIYGKDAPKKKEISKEE
ncbi:MAG: tetratricopeptide repeat protein [Elusimicrobia bacterium]|nr:tetratricopeptide repeat protein [Elusimicrobiota bacterium]